MTDNEILIPLAILETLVSLEFQLLEITLDEEAAEWEEEVQRMVEASGWNGGE